MRRSNSFPPRKVSSSPRQWRLLAHHSPLKFEDVLASLDIDHLETLLCRHIPHWTGDNGSLRFQGIADRVRKANRSCTRELEQVADWLSDFLDGALSKDLSFASLADVHSCIGMVHEEARHYQAATHSYLRALWILSQEQPANQEQLAVTLYRLGSSYGRTGKHAEMRETLKRAFSLWEGAPLRRPRRKQPLVYTQATEPPSSMLEFSEARSQPLFTVREETDFEEASACTTDSLSRHASVSLRGSRKVL